VRYRDREWLEEKYIEQEWSTTDIAKFCEVSHKTICRWMHKFNISVRDSQSSQLTGPKRQKREVARDLVRDYLDKRAQTIKESRGDKPTLNWQGRDIDVTTK
jgi:transposase